MGRQPPQLSFLGICKENQPHFCTRLAASRVICKNLQMGERRGGGERGGGVVDLMGQF